MKIVITDNFMKSFKENIIDAEKWYKFKFWQNKWWDFEQGIKNLKDYFKVIFNLCPYDGSYPVLQLAKISLERLLPYLENGNEIEETRLPKVKNIKRSIELIDNYIKNDYFERSGWVSNENSLLPDYKPSEENIKALEQGHKLQEDEWEELFILLKDLRSWWD